MVEGNGSLCLFFEIRVHFVLAHFFRGGSFPESLDDAVEGDPGSYDPQGTLRSPGEEIRGSFLEVHDCYNRSYSVPRATKTVEGDPKEVPFSDHRLRE